MQWVADLLAWLPWSVVMVVAVLTAHRTGRLLMAVLTGDALFYVLGLGIGLGLAGFFSPRIERVLTPMMDITQTVPAFAYLLPILMLFGFGPAVGLIAGIVIAVMAMVLDRITHGLAVREPEMPQDQGFAQRRRFGLTLLAAALVSWLAAQIMPALQVWPETKSGPKPSLARIQVWPETWAFDPSEVLNRGIEGFVAAAKPVLDTVKNFMIFTLILPLKFIEDHLPRCTSGACSRNGAAAQDVRSNGRMPRTDGGDPVDGFCMKPLRRPAAWPSHRAVGFAHAFRDGRRQFGRSFAQERDKYPDRQSAAPGCKNGILE